MHSLNQTLDAALRIGGPNFYKERTPELIYSNLNQKFDLRPYQKEAFGRFIFYLNDYHDRPQGVPMQLLFHMATGSGKTLIMAGLMLYLYEKGYRNFLFFVNSSTIIDKTKENFLNPVSNKYLFADSVLVGDKQVRIKEVDNFQAANQDDINIAFSTIQGLHSRLNTPKENCLTYDDFIDSKIVLISDEAHHINAETKKGKELDDELKEEIISWEATVKKIFNSNMGNVLLEFTATADLSHPEIEKKYIDKLIYDYPLKQFRIDGYSKEVKVLQADLTLFERALQSLILSQYRRKVFEKYKKVIKPVILFKSKTIKASNQFLNEFIDRVKKLSVVDFKKILDSQDDSLQRALKYFESNNISLDDLISELKEDFSANKLISVNSKEESLQKQLIINSLEDENNEYRAVFAVDKLNEGWDVLNLFDIVRLYDTRDSKDNKPGKTTMAEAQLIGRGARYCPFKITEEQPLNRRKYDNDITNELRICEELYYHSAYNPKYIVELNTALVEIGIRAKQTVERPIRLKNNFKSSKFYESGLIYLNEQQKYNREDIFSLKSSIINHVHKVDLKTGFASTSVAFTKAEAAPAIERKPVTYRLIELGEQVIRKALNKIPFYQFSNLKSLLPNLNSIEEFVYSDNYLGKITVDVSGVSEQATNLTAEEKLNIAIEVLETISSNLVSDRIEFKGSKEFKPFLLKDKIKDKVLNFSISESGEKEFGKSMLNPLETDYFLDLSKRDWYVFEDCFGTSEEKLLVKYIDKIYDKLKVKYESIYLVRNERHFKVYNFEDGKPLEPDFVLFLVNNQPELNQYYQIFIEPKGQHLLKQDEWKEKFLLSLKDEHKIEQLWSGKEYVIWGMPFFNEALRQTEFDSEMNNLLISAINIE